MRQSLKAFAEGPVSLAVLAADVLFASIAVARSDEPWMWLCFAAVVLVLFSFWRFHQIRNQEPEPTQIFNMKFEPGSQPQFNLPGSAGEDVVRFVHPQAPSETSPEPPADQ